MWLITGRAFGRKNYAPIPSNIPINAITIHLNYILNDMLLSIHILILSDIHIIYCICILFVTLPMSSTLEVEL